MNDAQYMLATSRTDPMDGYAPDGEIATRLGRSSALLHYVMGIVTEAGELMDALKKHAIYGRELDEVNLIEEVGDLQWYEARLLAVLGSSFAEARERNIKKLKRRYPDGFTEQDALTRDLEAERSELERAVEGDTPSRFLWCRCEKPEPSVSDGDEVPTCLVCGGFGMPKVPEPDASKAVWRTREAFDDDEIRDLLGATLHGPLPPPTMSRVFASLWELTVARHRVASLTRFARIGTAAVTAIASPGGEKDALEHATPEEVSQHIADIASRAASPVVAQQPVSKALRALADAIDGGSPSTGATAETVNNRTLALLEDECAMAFCEAVLDVAKDGDAAGALATLGLLDG